MKKLAFISLFLTLAFGCSIASHAQILSNSSNLTAGQCLQRSANHIFAGMALSVASAIPLMMPDFQENTAKMELERLTNNFTTSESEARATNKRLITPEELNRRMQEFQKDAESNKYRRGNYIVGGIFATVAIICYIDGIQYIKLAGRKLELQSSPNTVGLAIKF